MPDRVAGKAPARPRLLDVARAAGVSRGTASNVFTHPERVGTELRAKVAEAAAALGYEGPNPTARYLRSGRAKAIGVVVPEEFTIAEAIGNPFFRMLLTGVAEVCDAAGVNLVLLAGSGITIGDAMVDGFILTRSEYVGALNPGRLRHLPFVLMDADTTDGSVVAVDARSACRQAVEHLVALGHRRFGIVSFMRDRTSAAVLHPPGKARAAGIAGLTLDREKLRGYADALSAAGLDIDDVPVVQAHPADRTAAALILDAAPDATAIVTMADMQAIAVIEEARRRGLSVPRDLSVVGFNDIPEAALATPGLTTVDARGVERGRVAARMLLEPEARRRVVIPAALVVRESTAIAPG